MVRKYGWLLVLLGMLAMILSGCDDSDGGDVDADEEGTIISGKVAQTYVSGAIVIADKVTGGDELGDFQFDPDEEVSTYSDADGNYTLIIPPNYGEYVLCSKGGTVRNSQGVRVQALPMLAPRGTTNLTLVTTLVALHPSLKNKIGEDFDKDVANRNGVPWRILRLAKVAETFLQVLVEGNDPILQPADEEGETPGTAIRIRMKFNILKKLARALAADDTDLSSDSRIALAVVSAVGRLGDDPDIVVVDDRFPNFVVLAGLMERVTLSVLSLSTDGDVVVESDVLAEIEAAIAAAMAAREGNTLAFNPTAQVLPTPNDVIWSDTDGEVVFPLPADDPAARALYTAVNALHLKGLSPNTPIAIPLENTTPIKAEALQNNVRLINYGNLLGLVYGGLGLGDPAATTPEAMVGAIKSAIAATPEQTMADIQTIIFQNRSAIFAGPLEVVQEGNFIKIFPLQPLAPGSKYLTVLLKEVCGSQEEGCIVFSDENGVVVREPTLYRFLKLDEPLTGSLADLEPLRESYATIYNDLLPLLGMEKENTLEIFTFTTASKTLSTDDFGLLSAYLAGQLDSLDAVREGVEASGNLPFGRLTAEYGAIHDRIPPMTIVNAGDSPVPTFVSVKLDSPDLAQFGVPYGLENEGRYTDAVAIYQHGLGGSKENAAVLTDLLDMPIIAMDLPRHGDRTAEGVPSGAEYLTINLPQTRINLYQSFFDMTVLLRNLRAGLFDLDGDGNVNASGEAPVDLDDIPATVYFVGDSMGAITGSVFATYNADQLDRVVLTAGGANWAAILDRATNGKIEALIDSLGVERNSVEYFLALGLIQTIMDPADPVWQAGPAIQGKTLLRSAYMDTLVSNIPDEILARTIGWTEPERVREFTGTPPTAPDWYMFGGKEGLAANWIPHGFRYVPENYPEAADYFDEAYITAAAEFAARQTAAFADAPGANALAFYPSEAIDRAILPFPNDIAWAGSDGRVRLPVPDLAADPAGAALYTAFNALDNRGFSPNTPISIPLVNSTAVSLDALATNIELVNLNMLMGVLYGELGLGDPTTVSPDEVQAGVMGALSTASAAEVAALQEAVQAAESLIWGTAFYVGQEENFIKIYPVEPLSAGSTYLVYILERAQTAQGGESRFVDVNGVPVREPLFFPYLKSEDPLTDELEGLEPLRAQYEPIFDLILPVLGVEKANTLELMTFTTADKSLSLTDFGAVSSFLGRLMAGEAVSLEDLGVAVTASDNLPYVRMTAEGPVLAIDAEYNQINAQIPPATAVDMPPGSFISVDIASPTMEQVPVPYGLFNGNSYTGSVVMYQHAFFETKAEGEEIAEKLAEYGLAVPVLAMDLPRHGDRVAEAGDPSGADFLTPNIPQDRINLYQSYFDMTVMLNNLKAGLFNLDGDADVNLPGEAVVDEDDIPENIYFLGVSGGSILGSVFARYNSDALDRIVLNHAGANMVSILDLSDAEDMANLIDSLGLRKNTLPYFVALGMIQTLLDPADPVYLADAAIRDKTIAQTGYGAGMPPFVSAVIAGDTIGFPEPIRITDFTEPLPVTPGHYLLGGKAGLEDNGVPTSFLFDFVPEEGSGVDPDYLEAAREAGWRQITGFFGN